MCPIFGNIFLIVVTFTLILLQGGVLGQNGNCHFDAFPDDATTVDISGRGELSPVNTTLWSSMTQFVTGAAVTQSPHLKYVQGLRYSSRYDYIATDDFQHFITDQRSDVIQRDVTFSCQEGGNRRVTFFFHIDDENNMAPSIDPSELRYRVSKSGAIGDVQILGTFSAVDRDLWEEHGVVEVISSRPAVFPVTATLKEGVDHEKDGWTWDVTLSINWTEAVIGEWNFLIVVGDGKWSRSRSVVVDVVG